MMATACFSGMKAGILWRNEVAITFSGGVRLPVSLKIVPITSRVKWLRNSLERWACRALMAAGSVGVWIIRSTPSAMASSVGSTINEFEES